MTDTITPAKWTDADVAAFTTAHVTYAALVAWLDHCEDNADQADTMDGYAWTDSESARAHAAGRVDPQMRAALERQAYAFAAAHLSDLSTWFDPSQAGYDLWMTRTGQGVGFTSRYLPNDPDDTFSAYALSVRHKPDAVVAFDAAARRLDTASDALPWVETYVGDDGRIYLAGGGVAHAARTAALLSRVRRVATFLSRLARAVAGRP